AVLLVMEAGVRMKLLIEQEGEAGEQALTMVDAPVKPRLFKQIENRLLVVDFDADIPLMLARGPFVINVSARCARMDERTVGKGFGRNRGEPMIADRVSVGQSVNHRQRLRPVTPHDVSRGSRNLLIRVRLLVLVDGRCVVSGESLH